MDLVMATRTFVCDEDYINYGTLTRATQDVLKYLVVQGVAFYWDRDGFIQKIPSAVLQDTIATYDFWVTAPDRWQVMAPSDVGKIFWDQTVEAHNGGIRPETS